MKIERSAFGNDKLTLTQTDIRHLLAGVVLTPPFGALEVRFAPEFESLSANFSVSYTPFGSEAALLDASLAA